MRFKLVTTLASAAAITASMAFISPAQAAPDPTYEHYVALGDSYTAGPVLPTTTVGALGCAHSSRNYPAYLAAYLGVDTFTDVSCSSARSRDLAGSQPEDAPMKPINGPQLYGLSKDTDLVTIGMGGNDFGLFGDLVGTCVKFVLDGSTADHPCKDAFTQNGVDTKKRDAEDIEANIEKNLSEIKEKAPNAKIVVIGYLSLLRATESCEEVPFRPGDVVWGSEVTQILGASIKTATEGADATYVDMPEISKDHSLCAGDQSWVNGLIPSDTGAISFHPLPIGMEETAKATYRTLEGSDAPETSDAAVQAVQQLPHPVDVDGLNAWLRTDDGAGGLPADTPPIPGLKIPAKATPPTPTPTEPSATQSPTAGGITVGHQNPASSSELLPDTGGPNQLILLAGICGVLGGSGVLIAARPRRRPRPARH